MFSSCLSSSLVIFSFFHLFFFKKSFVSDTFFSCFLSFYFFGIVFFNIFFFIVSSSVLFRFLFEKISFLILFPHPKSILLVWSFLYFLFFLGCFFDLPFLSTLVFAQLFFLICSLFWWLALKISFFQKKQVFLSTLEIANKKIWKTWVFVLPIFPEKDKDVFSKQTKVKTHFLRRSEKNKKWKMKKMMKEQFLRFFQNQEEI